MALIKKNKSEVTICMTVTLTDVIEVPSDEGKAQKRTEVEVGRLANALNKISAVDNVDIQKVKIFPNIKDGKDSKE